MLRFESLVRMENSFETLILRITIDLIIQIRINIAMIQLQESG